MVPQLKFISESVSEKYNQIFARETGNDQWGFIERRFF